MIDKIPVNTKILYKDSYPIFLEGGDTAILAIHGYTGTPHDMLYLGQRLNAEGFTYYCPRLPGHGTNLEDFMQSNWHDWLRRVVDSYIELNSKYKTVYITGLSMGGILTAILAAKFKPKKIALSAPALMTRNSTLKYTPFLKYFIKKVPRKEVDKYDNGLQPLADQYWTYDIPPKAADLYKLQKLGVKALPEITSDTLTIVSKTDDTVPLEVTDLIEKNIKSTKKKTVVLEQSHHVVVNDIAKEYVADEIIKWFKD